MTATESAGNFSLLLRRILHTKAALVGFSIIGILAAMTIYALVAVPLESFSQWNDPGFWIDYPKSAATLLDKLDATGGKFAESYDSWTLRCKDTEQFIGWNSNQFVLV